MTRLPPIEELLPHGKEIRFVDQIEEMDIDDGSGRCRARFSSDTPLARGGQVPAYLLIEAVAQTVAIYESVRRARREESAELRTGYLVGLRKVGFSCASVPVDVGFEIDIKDTGSAAPLGTFEFDVRLDGVVVVGGKMSTYIE